ncbi:DEAD/DEAH box helicase family protein [Candidatus Micrarchaeota archaeon]|jgi:type I restriction enzyme R subunit|nr:DEAD/DEAH box helicase family protein [Candidatus Micrarchaeota archaeon]
MNSNFTFLQSNWPDIYEEALQVEKHAYTAPRTSVFYARRTVELVIEWLYIHDPDLRKPYETHLAALMHESSFKKLLPYNLFHLINYIRKIGNQAVHSHKPIRDKESLTSLRNLYLFCEWLAKQYSQEQSEFPKYDENLIPRQGEADKNAEELSRIQEQLEEKDEVFKKQEILLAEYKEELKQFRAQIKATKEKNKSRISHKDYSEAETRELFIDLLLREAGWDPQRENVAEYEVDGMPNNKGIGFVDYVLWGDDGLPLALVEAKRTTHDAQKGQRQAELYADQLERMHGQRPIIFLTNGYEHWIWQDTLYPPRPVQGFYTKDQLQTLINRRNLRKSLIDAQVNDEIAGRYYQKLAIQSVLEQLEQKDRRSLIVMATGTGKTRVSIALVEILMKQGWIKNVLFLADRNALLTQAKAAYNNLLPQATTVDITQDKEDTSSRIVFSTYPTMMNMIDEAKKDGVKRFGVGRFDLIIIDEAHRSVYQKYGAIFEYFDSLLIGLTATPKAEVDHNTYELFGLEDHNPTYSYELDLAVEDGFLVPPKQIEVPTKFLSEGLTYDELSEEEKEMYEMTFEDDEGQLPLMISASHFNDWIFNKSTVDNVLSYLMENGIKVEGGDRLGKTIIFAKNHKHAKFIEERFNKNYPYYNGRALRVIDNYADYAHTLIDEFKQNKPDSPFIAVSVDMLDTGIDIPELVNLVFFKVTHSKAKFWQMIGRGTRLCPKLFGPSSPEDDKREFLIFDFCGNFEFFKVNPEGVKGSTQKSLSQQIFEKRVEIAHELQSGDYIQNEELQELRASILNSLHEDVKVMDPLSFNLRPDKRYIDEFSNRDRWNNLSKQDVIDLQEHIAPHSNLVAEDDEFARRFDSLILTTQVEQLKHDRSSTNSKNRVVTLAELLYEKANIPAVADKIATINKVREDAFWENPTVERLEEVRRDMRDLIRLLDPPQRKAVYTNFSDVIYDPIEPTGAIINDPQINRENYVKRVQSIIRENEFFPVIQKIKNNEKLDDSDIKELEFLLVQNSYDIDKTKIEEALAGETLGEFIRSIVGLEKEAAKAAFAKLMKTKNLNAAQMQFLDKIIDHIVQTGLMKPGDLYDQPFTFLDDRGIDGVFEPADRDQIFGILTDIRQNAQFTFV